MNIFIAFANQDRDVRDKLLRQMNLVKDRLGWNIWSAKEIKQRLIDSEVVILLLSTDFFNSKYIVETELPKVVEKHKQGDCQIIPVIARVCHWKDTPFGEYAELGDIQALPVGERPIMSKGHWGHEDEPYFEVVEGIKKGIKGFQERQIDNLMSNVTNVGIDKLPDENFDKHFFKTSLTIEFFYADGISERILHEMRTANLNVTGTSSRPLTTHDLRIDVIFIVFDFTWSDKLKINNVVKRIRQIPGIIRVEIDQMNKPNLRLL